ncbi:Killer toxin subunits alpha/beta [Zancudomyces culisetae]|uniref:Killer toxin subunits alpha/beta n=1 Tax=Zancudomyces culisetae TaxID=1213189 RepID=A0A1R1PP46_ZANCU|nr:Killer toxin subunits alpha/beta [Zancudomyces culisetae]|eukprot:OMH82739.1 Killer toxin subunits alpha/beta [Zancudomyces culisetae]
MDQIEEYNKNTWHWDGCSKIQIGMNICLSSGNPPMPVVDPDAQCGPSSLGNKTCPLNACCGYWGYCGTTEEFCGKGCQIGGWAFSDPGETQHTFTNIARNPQNFIDSVVNMINEYNLDGIDIDWEYPVTPDRSGSDDDASNYVNLVKLLKQRLPDKSVSIAAPASFWYLRHYEIAEMSKYLDYIGYMTYDLHGTWDSTIPSLGPYLKSHVSWSETMNALTMITKSGVPSNKVILGIGSYGRSFIQSDSSCYSSECTFVSGANPGKCTGTSGYLALAEINEIINSGNVRNKMYNENDDNTILLYGSNEWISYLDNDSILKRESLAKSMNLKGTMEWAIDLKSYDYNKNNYSNDEYCNYMFKDSNGNIDSDLIEDYNNCLYNDYGEYIEYVDCVHYYIEYGFDEYLDCVFDNFEDNYKIFEYKEDNIINISDCSSYNIDNINNQSDDVKNTCLKYVLNNYYYNTFNEIKNNLTLIETDTEISNPIISGDGFGGITDVPIIKYGFSKLYDMYKSKIPIIMEEDYYLFMEENLNKYMNCKTKSGSKSDCFRYPYDMTMCNSEGPSTEIEYYNSMDNTTFAKEAGLSIGFNDTRLFIGFIPNPITSFGVGLVFDAVNGDVTPDGIIEDAFMSILGEIGRLGIF